MHIKPSGIERLAVGAATLITTSGWLFAVIQTVLGVQAYRRWKGEAGLSETFLGVSAAQDYQVLFSVFQTILLGLVVGGAAHCLAAITLRVTRDAREPSGEPKRDGS